MGDKLVANRRLLPPELDEIDATAVGRIAAGLATCRDAIRTTQTRPTLRGSDLGHPAACPLPDNGRASSSGSKRVHHDSPGPSPCATADRRPGDVFMTESEVLDFLQHLGARVSTELGLELDGAALGRIAALVFAAANMRDPDATARHMYRLLMEARMLN